MDKGQLKIISNAVLVLITCALILLAVAAIAKTGRDSADREGCRDEVLVRSQLKIAGHTLLNSLDNCKMDQVDVKRNDIGDRNSIDKYKVHKLVADEMYDCWYQFERGEKDFLSDVDAWKGDNWCFVCTRFDFDKDSKKDLPEINVDEFNSFLANEPIPLNNKDQTFYNYFFENSDGVSLRDTFSTIETKDPVYVVFFADKRQDLWEELFVEDMDKTEWLIAGGSCLVGGKVGAVIGGTFGSVVPIAGTTVGAVAGGLIGCASGLVIGLTTEVVVRKTDFVSSLYVGNDAGVMEGCRQ